ncbi:MAG: acetyl-CoA decarbonylase/synthase complex subunit gamma [Candidatus Bathyarchaeota archaeon]|nr:MAG: acetyl-CoA decarbonylase/synthase complex subunit gamma [Candidatus Bathyarchaeota archaeon]
MDMSAKELSPIDVYKLLPRTNCKECGEENCMAFATRVVNREIPLEECKPLLLEEHKDSYEKLKELLKPTIREVVIGIGDRAVKIGGELVMYRHEFTYMNPTAFIVAVDDEMSEEDLLKTARAVEDFKYEYIGQVLKLDGIAVRSITREPERFQTAVKSLIEKTDLPLVICSFDPNVIEAGLVSAKDRRPLIYAANQDNWKEMADLALMYKCPLGVFAPNNIPLLRSLSKTLLEYGLEDLILDPGTFKGKGLGDTVNNFTMIRRAACKENDELLAFPLLGIPMIASLEKGDLTEKRWDESWLTSLLVARYADIEIISDMEGWAILPDVVFRQNIYTDPRKPVAVDAVIKEIGNPNENSPVFMTTNFALTYYTVADDIERAGIDGFLLVIDTEGISVESAVAGRKLTADLVAEAIKEYGVEEKVKHRKLIIPGRASRLSGEIEDATKWEVLVGPLDSSGIPRFLQEKWAG